MPHTGPDTPDFPLVTLDGVTELRIHGVSGTPVESMLQDPHPVQVWGDKTAGFYRRPDDAPEATDHLEAYSWGRLTSGASARAGWLLLLPFMLVNVASWAHPARRGDRSHAVGTMSGAVRVAALTLTATMVLAAAFLGMDVLAWQCGGDEVRCGAKHWYTGFMAEGAFERPGVRIATGAAVPIALVLLFWYLSNKTAKKYEEMCTDWGSRQPKPAPDPSLPRGVWDMSHPGFWVGGGPVRRLRSLHLAGSFALVGALVAYATGSAIPKASDAVGATLTAVAVTILLVIAALLSSPLSGRRRELIEQKKPKPLYVTTVRLAPYVAGGVLLAALAYAVLAPEDARHAVALPGLRGAKHWVLGVQGAALTLLLLANVGALRARDKSRPDAAAGLLLKGFAAPFVALLGVVVASGFAAGVTIHLADYLGCPGRCSDPDSVRFVLPSEYLRTARGFFSAGVALLVVGPWFWFVVRKRRLRTAQANVVSEYPGFDDPARRRAIASTQATAALSDDGAWPLAALVVLGVAGGFALEAFPGSRVDSPATTAGTWLVGAFALGLVALGRLAYKNEGTRRTVGILWDLGTFWPRAAHPFAPPCYCERTVPEFTQRVDQLRGTRRGTGRGVVVSAHSQGTVIGLATLLQLRHDPADVALLTYGSPLHRLYARAFPHFFGLPVLDWTRNAYGGRWVNLYRRSDPIGGPVTCADADVAPDAVRPDRRLHDPAFATPEYAFTPPVTRGHSGYFADAAFDHSVGALAAEVRGG
jgi:hypothetical protein